ncbi:MAG TPA: hypothetical protein VGN16_02235 [Acidobacteriaceae bacterium]|jgi:hypothetical protein
MRRTSWIWLAGTFAWLFDAGASLETHHPQSAELAFLLSALFAVAWLFYRSQP